MIFAGKFQTQLAEYSLVQLVDGFLLLYIISLVQLRMTVDNETVDMNSVLSEEVLQMSTDDLVARTRLLDNECKIMRSGQFRF